MLLKANQFVDFFTSMVDQLSGGLSIPEILRDDINRLYQNIPITDIPLESNHFS